MTIQITIIKIEGYGPWTLKLGSDREAQLQIFQANLYSDLQKLFSKKDAIVYFNRFDELIAISNGLSLEDHLSIEREITDMYKDLNISMSIGTGATPIDANIAAYNSRKNNNLLDKSKLVYADHQVKLLYKNPDKPPTDMFAQILHLDIDNSTKVSNSLSPYEITTRIMKMFSNLIELFSKQKSMTFFIGGDNFMVISNTVPKEKVSEIIGKIYKSENIKLNCGIGIACTARKAVQAATEALDTIRNLRDQGIITPIYEIQWN
ncbi:MAG TPA: GTP cyclohydrolase IIa [Nitrososphaeraceae archaeon]|jgi:GTP cyclohydrolase IIa